MYYYALIALGFVTLHASLGITAHLVVEREIYGDNPDIRDVLHVTRNINAGMALAWLFFALVAAALGAIQ